MKTFQTAGACAPDINYSHRGRFCLTVVSKRRQAEPSHMTEGNSAPLNDTHPGHNARGVFYTVNA